MKDEHLSYIRDHPDQAALLIEALEQTVYVITQSVKAHRHEDTMRETLPEVLTLEMVLEQFHTRRPIQDLTDEQLVETKLEQMFAVAEAEALVGGVE